MEQNWKQLVQECLHKSQTAQLAFYRRYAPSLYPVGRRMLGSPEAAEEVLQDAFLKIFTHLVLFEDEAHLKAWMRRVVQRTAIDALRREPFEWEELNDELMQTAEEEEPDDSIVCHRAEKVKQAIELLPPGYRTVLSLYLFEGYDLEEIAEVLQLKPASARSQYLRAKAKLLKQLIHCSAWTN